MKINYNRIYVGNIMVCDNYTYEIDSFGDCKKPKSEGHIVEDGAFELFIKLGEDISGSYYVPVKSVKGEHNLFKLSESVDKYIQSGWKKPLKYREEILQEVVHNLGMKYVGNVKLLYPDKNGQVYLRDLKKLREKIKVVYYKSITKKQNSTNNLLINEEDESVV